MGKPFGSTQATGGTPGGQAANNGFTQFLSNGINTGTFGGGDFGTAITNMLQGRTGDPTSLNQYFAQANSGNSGGLLPGQLGVGSGYNTPQFQGFNPTNPGMINGQYNAPQYQASQLQGFNPSQFGINNSTLSNGLGTTANLADAGSADVNGTYGKAVQQILQQQSDHAVGDLRARYGASGSGLGSNAQYAESNYLSQNTPQIAAALGNINQQERGLNLQQRQQDLSNFQGGRQADISQLGLLANNAQAGGQLNLNAILGLNSQNMQNSQFQNQFNQGNSQFGATFGQNAQQQNAANQMQMNQLNQNQNQFQNQFGQQNSQFGAQFGQNADQFNVNALMQNQAMQNQYGLGLGSLGATLQGQQLNSQQNAINSLLQAYMQQSGLNTAQRQTTYQPGWVQQAAGLAGQIGGIASGFSNPFSNMMNAQQQSMIPGSMSNIYGGGIQSGQIGTPGATPQLSMPNVPMSAMPQFQFPAIYGAP